MIRSGTRCLSTLSCGGEREQEVGFRTPLPHICPRRIFFCRKTPHKKMRLQGHCLHHLSPAQTPHPSPPRHAVSHSPSEPRRSPDSIGSKSLPLTTLPRHPRGVAWAVVWRVGRQAEAKLVATVQRLDASSPYPLIGSTDKSRTADGPTDAAARVTRYSDSQRRRDAGPKFSTQHRLAKLPRRPSLHIFNKPARIGQSHLGRVDLASPVVHQAASRSRGDTGILETSIPGAQLASSCCTCRLRSGEGRLSVQSSPGLPVSARHGRHEPRPSDG